MSRNRLPRTSSANRTLFPDRDTRQTAPPTRTRGRGPGSFYSSNGPSNHNNWQPGEILPTNDYNEQIEELKETFHSAVASMQSAIGSEIIKLRESIDNLDQRLADIDQRVIDIEGMTVPSESSLMLTPTNTHTPPQKRKRNTPVEIQSEIRAVHNHLPDENKLKPEEAIDSTHNREVILKVSTELEGKYDQAQIRKTLCVYRRTLKRPVSERERQKKLQRSRQQRLWERRSKHVSEEEKDWWKDVKPCMMSDEETLDDQQLSRRRPDWRGDEFNKFMDRLDERSYLGSKHPHKVRVIGSPLKCPPPPDLKEWMINNAEAVEEDHDCS